MEHQTIFRLISVNLTANFLLLSQLYQSGAVHPKATRLVVVSSLAAVTGYPTSAVYAATKAGLLHFAQSVACTFKHCTVVLPGATDTPQAVQNTPDLRRRDKWMSAEAVAGIVTAKSLKTGASLVVPGYL